MRTAAELVAWCKSKIGCGYIFGSRGQVITESFLQSKAAQYPRMYTADYLRRSRRWIGQVAYDCGGLIDAFLGIDWSAQGYLDRATKRGGISTLPETQGALVFMEDSDGDIYHVGVYIGGGKVIEARGVDYGVVETTVAGRGWDYWGLCSLIDYSEDTDVIQRGMAGTAVKAWQEALLKLNYALPRWGADSDFGGETEIATKLFQASAGLPQTGIVDADTAAKAWDALRLIQPDVSAYTEQISALQGDLSNVRKDVADRDTEIARLNAKLAEVASACRVLSVLSTTF